MASVAGCSRQRILPLVLITLIGAPLLHVLGAALVSALQADAWRALAAERQLWHALALSLWTGTASALIAVGLAAWMLRHGFDTPVWAWLVRMLAPMLAVPHAAFAIGFAFLIAPSGWVLRALSPWATGLTAPPPWSTTQDPWGLGLIAVLAAKELPFLLWAAASHLQRPDVAQRLRRELQLARSMGYGPASAWWRVAWPQIRPRLRWPVLAVLAYSMTVVDLALVIGPGAPPTLAVLAWTWLLDADPATNAQGAAAAWTLAVALGGVAALWWAWLTLPPWRRRWSDGRRGRQAAGPGLRKAAWLGMVLLVASYAGVMLALAIGSVSGVWPFPHLWPQTLTREAWVSVAHSTTTVATTLTLALASSVAALLWAVAWLETAPPAWDHWLRRLVYLPLVLPPVLWVLGMHATTLWLGIEASWPGLWLAHTLACVPYVLIALSPAYMGFDPRYRFVAASLGHGRLRFLLAVKWPLLRAALASALAVGFAVSVAQYLPTLFIGAGRFSTITTEAVTLASGAQRSLTSAYAWLQWLLPVAGFALAASAGRPRRFRHHATQGAPAHGRA
jgi:putative thiamine transport system permease protein